jgi:hypothetical protein
MRSHETARIDTIRGEVLEYAAILVRITEPPAGAIVAKMNLEAS